MQKGDCLLVDLLPMAFSAFLAQMLPNPRNNGLHQMHLRRAHPVADPGAWARAASGTGGPWRSWRRSWPCCTCRTCVSLVSLISSPYFPGMPISKTISRTSSSTAGKCFWAGPMLSRAKARTYAVCGSWGSHSLERRRWYRARWLPPCLQRRLLQALKQTCREATVLHYAPALDPHLQKIVGLAETGPMASRAIDLQVAKDILDFKSPLY